MSTETGVETICDDLKDVDSDSGLPAHAGIVFEDHGSLDYLDIQSVYSQVMIESGVLVYAFYNINGSHTEKAADAYIDATCKAFEIIREAMDEDSLEGILKGGKVNPVFKRNRK